MDGLGSIIEGMFQGLDESLRVTQENQQLRTTVAELVAENERLRECQQEHVAILLEWHGIWQLLGGPGALGSSKVAETRAEVERLRAENEALREPRTEADERALPLSGEWVDAAIGGFNFPGGVRIVGMQGQWDVFRVFGHTSVHIASIETRGQLLDLLSGLGVRK